MIHCWGFDPGETTGWCHVSIHENEVGIFNCGEGNHVQIGNLLFDNLALKTAVQKAEIETCFVIEKYILNSKISQSPWSLETTGLVRYFTGIYQVPLHFVMPSQHKGLISNDVIKKAGLWVPNKGHAMDAVRLCLWYITSKKRLLQECLMK